MKVLRMAVRSLISVSAMGAAMAFTAGPLVAQTGTVTGLVADASTTQPLSGAQVSISAENVGGLTRANGRFLIPGLPVGIHSLEVRIIGYATQTTDVTVSAGETTLADFQLEAEAIALDEIVVTGTGGVTSRRQLGQTVETIGSDVIESVSIPNVTELLSGRIVGMVPSSQPAVGTSANIVLRGAVSVTQRNRPLIYIDGIRVDDTFSKVGSTRQGTTLDRLNPNDIERVEVVKGAAAATLYGTEASSGVIHIITKRGTTGAPVWDASIGFEGTKIPQGRVFESWGYDFVTKELRDGGTPALDYIGGWGSIQDYNLSVRGGLPTVQYFASGRWRDEVGNMGRAYRDFQGTADANARLNLTMQPTDRLELRVDLNTVQSDIRQPMDNNLSWGSGYLWGFWLGTARNAASQFPYGGRYSRPAYQIAWPPPHGYSWADDSFGLADDEHFIPLDTWPPVSAVEARQESLRLTMSGAISYDWGKGIRSQLTLGQDKVKEEYVEHINKGWHISTPEGRRLIRTGERTQVTVDLKTSWRTEVNPDLTSTFVVGGQSFWEDNWIRSFGTSEFTLRALELLPGGSIVRTPDEAFREVINAGVYAQEEVGLWNRLFVNAGVRIDGNSAFGENFGFEVYPKAGASWVVSEHDFWPFETWDQFRVRAAVGAAGLQPGAFDASQTWLPGVSLANLSVVTPGNPGNPDLEAERTLEWELGAELGLAGGRVGVDMVYYHATTTGALMPAPSGPSSGFTQARMANLGEIVNQGVETSLNVNWIRRPNLGFETTFQAAWVKSEVTDMGGIPSFRFDIAGGSRLRRYHATMAEGYPPGAWISPVKDPNNPYTVSVPINQLTSLNQITPNILRNAQGGDSLAFQGRPLPSWTGSVLSSLRLPGGLTVGATITGAYDYDMFTEVALIQAAASRVSERVGRFEQLLDDPNTSDAERQRIADDFGGRHPSSISDWLFDDSFIRLLDVSVNWQVPERYVARMPGMDAMTVRLTATNLGFLYRGCPEEFCMADPLNPYHGIPDAGQHGAAGAFGMNTDYGNPPTPRRFGLRVRTTF